MAIFYGLSLTYRCARWKWCVESSQKAYNQVNLEEIVNNPDWAHFNSDDEESDFDEVLEDEDSTDEEEEDFIELE